MICGLCCLKDTTVIIHGSLNSWDEQLDIAKEKEALKSLQKVCDDRKIGMTQVT